MLNNPLNENEIKYVKTNRCNTEEGIASTLHADARTSI